MTLPTGPATALLDDPATDPFDVARDAAAYLARVTGVERHDLALVLGS